MKMGSGKRRLTSSGQDQLEIPGSVGQKTVVARDRIHGRFEPVERRISA
jgi:hypothetical protein